MHNGLFGQLTVLLAIAVAVLALLRRAGIPPTVGYIGVGILIGPHGLRWIDLSGNTQLIAELGVVFLMFMVGLEFSLPRLLAARDAVFRLGSAQVVTTTAVAGGAALLAGFGPAIAAIIGAAVAMSSTAISLKQLSDQGELGRAHARLAIGALLFQDLATLPVLVLVPQLAPNGSDGEVDIVVALLRAAAVFAAVLVIGRWVTRPVLRWIAGTRSAELMMLATLTIALGAAFLVSLAGLSLPVGAFLVGMIIGETEFRHQVENDIRPFRDVLLGVFFASIGMRLDPSAVAGNAGLIAGLVATIVVGKAAVCWLVAAALGYRAAAALRTAIVLGHAGEFTLLILTQALTQDVLAAAEVQPLLTATVLTMVTAPLLIRYNRVLAARLIGGRAFYRHEAPAPGETADLDNHVILCGFGRVGRHLARLLYDARVPFLVVDLDPVQLDAAHADGYRILYGDVRRAGVLDSAGLDRARAVVVTFDRLDRAEPALRATRAARPDLPVLASAHRDVDAGPLTTAGASEAVPEDLGVTFVLGSALFRRLGLPTTEVEAYVARLTGQGFPAER